MPFHPEHSLLNVNLDKMHTIDTRSVEDLYGLWAVFSKASNVLEDGKRLENLSWRLWNRETFCCCPETKARSTHRLSSCKFPSRSNTLVPGLKTPELASSIESASSDDAEVVSPSSPITQTSTDVTRPELTRLSSLDDRSRGREKHITSGDLEKIVTSITQQQTIEPLSDLPPLAHPAVMGRDATEGVSLPSQPTPASTQSPETSLLSARPSEPQTLRERRLQHTTPIIVEQPADKQRHRILPQSSASTVLTQESRTSSQTSESPNSPATSMSTHNVVRGFVPGGTSSYRSQTQLAPEPIPIKKPIGTQSRSKKGACFMLGTSSESQDDGSLGSFQKQPMSTLSRRLTHQSGSSLKQESLPDEELKTKVQSSPVFESDVEEDDEDDVDVDDDDDDDIDDDDEEQDASDWEDEAVVDEDGSSAARDDVPRQTSLFQRVDSKPNLTSHRSLLTSMMHEGDRAREIAAQAAHSHTGAQTSASTRAAPARRQTCDQDTKAQGLAIGIAQAQAQAINVPNSGGNVALSPRSTRRNMLATELTESLRRNLLWERQQKARGNGASDNNLRRRHTALDVKKLSQQQQEAARPRMSRSQYQDNDFSANEYLHTGIGEYHAKGW